MRPGLVFDVYDDPQGAVLREAVPRPDLLPPFVKTAARLSPEQINDLPDDQFALVMLDHGRKMKKYATVDKGNTALSVLYFVKQARYLPKKAIKTAARNLLAACNSYGLQAPAQLKLAAMAQETSPDDPQARPSESRTNPRLGEEPDPQDMISRTNIQGVPGENVREIPLFPREKYLQVGQQVKQAGMSKFAGPLSDPEVLAALGIDVNGHSTSLAKQETRMRPAITRELPYVDVSGEPAHTPEDLPQRPEQTLLGDRYPVDSMEQVKLAAIYFVDNWRGLVPGDRRTYCVKLAGRMADLGLVIPDEVSRYGSPGYGADVESFVGFRRGLVQEDLHPALDMLIEKRAMLAPEIFARALEDFDKLAGLNWYWDGRVPDPYFSTFGPSREKLASENWSFSDGGAHIRESDLQSLARDGRPLVEKAFGADFADQFQKKPKTVFESLPKPNKIILARLAMSRNDGATG